MRLLKIKKLSAIFAAGLLATMIIGTAGVAQANQIFNGGFESGFDSWNVNGDVDLITGGDAVFVRTGDQSVKFDNYVNNTGTVITTGGAISQQFILQEADETCFGAWIRVFTDTAIANYDQIAATLGIYVNGNFYANVQMDPSTIGSSSFSDLGKALPGTDWILLSGTFNTSGLGGATAELFLNLQGQYFPGRTVVAMDDAFAQACAPVPEPSTLLLLGGGLFGLAGLTWRRRRNG